MFLKTNDIRNELKSKTESDTIDELLNETEELLHFGSCVWDVGGNTVAWTRGLYKLLDYDPEAAGTSVSQEFFLEHILEEYKSAFRQALDNAVRQGGEFTVEYVVRTASNSLKDISSKGKPIKDDEGRVVKVLCIHRDITALRTFEKERERSVRELNRSNKDLEEFAYIASHDLQEPLRKISMFTERLKAKYDKAFDREGEMFMERILASVVNMRTLIDSLLDFSRANRRSNNFEEVDLKTLIEGLVADLEPKDGEGNPDISFSGSFQPVEAVPSEMKQLFGNILSNAVKFRNETQPVRITITADRLSKTEKQDLSLPVSVSHVKIEVHDNGIGFDPEYSEKIFQIFQRLNGKAEYPGSGIGLAICKKIVEKHNGVIFAKSQPDMGATFTVILPEKNL